MPLRIPNADAQQVKLKLPVEVDPDGTAAVVIRPATIREESERDALYARVRRVYKDGPDGAPEEQVEFQYTYADVRELEVFLTLADCDIEMPDSTDQWAPLFRFDTGPDGKRRVNMSREEFRRAWGRLSSPVAQAISDAVHEVNRHWAPSFRR